MLSSTIGCYVHIPFCVKKCAYCDFNSYSGYGERLIGQYVDAIKQEIVAAEQAAAGEAIDTVFFGGGTPTAIPAADEAAILHSVMERLEVAPNAEITTEANPGTADIAGLEILRSAGFNRISFGVQSFDPGLLKMIDRIHSPDEAKAAVRAARAAGFENISIDLMFGLPGQTMTQWQDTLEQALELETDHLSMYALIVEDGTGFGTLMRKGRLFLPEDDLVADMYSHAIEQATSAGYAQYEISNFAKDGKQCRHNLHYWSGDDYYGFGAGAVGMRGERRLTNILSPAGYVKAIKDGHSAVGEEECISLDDKRFEAMMLGLRLTTDGVDIAHFQRRFGVSPLEVWPSEINKFTDVGMIEPNQTERLVLTSRGVFMANEVVAAFL